MLALAVLDGLHDMRELGVVLGERPEAVVGERRHVRGGLDEEGEVVDGGDGGLGGGGVEGRFAADGVGEGNGREGEEVVLREETVELGDVDDVAVEDLG